jgi:hypothetical protein
MTDPVHEASADPTEGSRLKPFYEVGDDGAKAYRPGSWWDSARQEECAIGTGSDGKQRCLPTSRQYLLGVFYSDPSCSAPLITTSKTACPTSYAIELVKGQACTQAYRYYRLSAPIVPVEIYGYDANHVCVSMGPPDSTALYVPFGPEIDPASFVGMSRGHD